MATLNEIFKWVFQNISPGETDPEKRVDADRVMDNYYTLRDIVALVEAQGVNADESNATNGASTVSQANLTIRTNEGETGLLDENDWVQIWDGGTNIWYLRNTVSDDELSFSDTHLAAGSGPSDYSDGGFIDGLIIKIVKFRSKVSKDDLILSGSHSDKLTAADLEISSSDTTKVNAFVEEHEDKLDDVVKADGSDWVINDNTVKAGALVKSADDEAIFLGDSPRNLSRGMFEDPIYAINLLYGLQETPAPANDYDIETTIVKSGEVSQKFSTNGSAQGIEILLDALIDHDLLAGKLMTIVAWIRSSNADKLDVGFYDDDNGYQVINQTHAADTWTKVSVTKTIGASATEVRGVIRSTDAVSTDHYVDIAGIYIGETAFDPTAPSVYASIVKDSLNSAKYNYLFNGAFASDFWLDGSSSYPVGYEGDATVVLGNGVSNYLYENASAHLSMAAAEDFVQYVGLISDGSANIPALQEILGKTVTASAMLKRDGTGNTTEVTLQIQEFIGSSWSEIAEGEFEVDEYDDWGQIAVSGEVSANAELVRVRILNDSGSALNFYLDGLMLTRTAYPVAYTVMSPWRTFSHQLNMAGSLNGAIMDCGATSAPLPLQCDAFIVGLKVYEGTTGTGTDQFYPRIVSYGGSTDDITELAVSLGSGENYATTGDHIEPVNEYDMLTVYCDSDGLNPGQDAVATVLLVRWAR